MMKIYSKFVDVVNFLIIFKGQMGNRNPNQVGFKSQTAIKTERLELDTIIKI